MTETVAPYAVTQQQSRGRRFEENPHPYRNPFERDRDRIIHCQAFRRLEAKTQVFMLVDDINDHYRTRLTHSIEVAQIGRTIAKALALNESLTEAICLGHDLGHSPFGHCGENALNDLMAKFDGFEHNRQALRIVDLLEHPYPDFRGLDLMYETRLALAKHHSPYDKPEDDDFSQLQCSLEGQIADVADRIAYNCHDLEDGLRAGLIDQQQLKAIKLFSDAWTRISADTIEDDSIRGTRIAKTIIDTLVTGSIDNSAKAIAAAGISSIEDVYSYPQKLIAPSKQGQSDLAELEKFLLENMYMHPSLRQTAENAKQWLTILFEKYTASPRLMPHYYQKLIPTETLQRTVCDYIAGMTDRFCLSMVKENS